jgi:hypothetical protein
METLKTLLDRKAWNFSRILRLMVGIAFLMGVVVKYDHVGLMAGLFFLSQAIFNFTVCGVGGSCNTNYSNNKNNNK